MIGRGADLGALGGARSDGLEPPTFCSVDSGGAVAEGLRAAAEGYRGRLGAAGCVLAAALACCTRWPLPAFSLFGFMPGAEMLVPRQAMFAVRVLVPVAPAVRALGGWPGDVAALVVAQRHCEPARCGCSDLVQGAACPQGSKVCSAQKDHVSATGGPAIQRHGRVP